VEEASTLSSGDGKETPCFSDEDLFKEPPPREDECPICFLAQPFNEGETTYFSCCGKVICDGCVHAAEHADDRGLCPFCRALPPTSNGEIIERIKERVAACDAVAIYTLGCDYAHGRYGLRQNTAKAMKLWLRAGELGCLEAYCNIGYAYNNGDGVERDANKAKYYWELAAMRGDARARHNLGLSEQIAGNTSRAMKHWMISAAAGWDDSLKEIREGYLKGYVTKDNFEDALRSHKDAKDEIKSDQREAAEQARRRAGHEES